MRKARELYIGLVPVSDEFTVDPSNDTQVANLMAMIDSNLREIKFKIFDKVFSPDAEHQGKVEQCLNIDAMDMEYDVNISERVEIIKRIMIKKDFNYDDDTTFPDILKKFTEMCEKGGILKDLSKLNDSQLTLFAKMITMAFCAGEDWVDSRNTMLESTDVPIFLVITLRYSDMNAMFGELLDPILYFGYALYSAIGNTFINDHQEELEFISDISLKYVRVADSVISKVPDNIDLMHDIIDSITAEYRSNHSTNVDDDEIPPGYKLN